MAKRKNGKSKVSTEIPVGLNAFMVEQLLPNIDKMVVAHQMILEATRNMFHILKTGDISDEKVLETIRILNKRASEKANAMVVHNEKETATEEVKKNENETSEADN